MYNGTNITPHFTTKHHLSAEAACREAVLHIVKLANKYYFSQGNHLFKDGLQDQMKQWIPNCFCRYFKSLDKYDYKSFKRILSNTKIQFLYDPMEHSLSLHYNKHPNADPFSVQLEQCLSLLNPKYPLIRDKDIADLSFDVIHHPLPSFDDIRNIKF
jgi:hypothetical protein